MCIIYIIMLPILRVNEFLNDTKNKKYENMENIPAPDENVKDCIIRYIEVLDYNSDKLSELKSLLSTQNNESIKMNEIFTLMKLMTNIDKLLKFILDNVFQFNYLNTFGIVIFDLSFKKFCLLYKDVHKLLLKLNEKFKITDNDEVVENHNNNHDDKITNITKAIKYYDDLYNIFYNKNEKSKNKTTKQQKKIIENVLNIYSNPYNTSLDYFDIYSNQYNDASNLYKKNKSLKILNDDLKKIIKKNETLYKIEQNQIKKQKKLIIINDYKRRLSFVDEILKNINQFSKQNNIVVSKYNEDDLKNNITYTLKVMNLIKNMLKKMNIQRSYFHKIN
jgi:hypothetical protein